MKLALKIPVLRPFRVDFTSRRNLVCPKPVRPINVTITGANSKIGQTLALLLKQCPLIDEVRLFDYVRGSCGIAVDLSHIDTNTKIKSFTGIHMLRPAIEEAKIVVVVGGEAIKPGYSEYELFKRNADYVRSVAMHTAEFNPKTILCINTPPITSMVPLASEEYKKTEVYDARRIIGMTALSVVRANSIVARYGEADPSKIMCPTIGGMGFKSCVAVVSQTAIGSTIPSPVADVLRDKVAKAEHDVLTLKYIENSGPCTVSTAFALARFVTNVARGLLDEFDGVESGFVRQTGETGNFLPYMGSLIKLGRHGVQTIHMPKTDNFECIHLQRAAKVIRQQILWGEGYVTGITTKKRRFKRNTPAYPAIHLKHVTQVGDVAFDPNMEEAQKYGKLVPDSRSF